MSTHFIGQIELVGCNFAPAGWAFCDGQLLSIAEYEPLFTLIGTTYGGDGQATFGLPDLRGRAALGMGQGSGLSNVMHGEVGGTEDVTLLTAQLPTHKHPLQAHSGTGTTSVPGTGVVLAQVAEDDGTPASSYSSAVPATEIGSLGANTGGQAMNIHNPFLGMNYVISLFGIYPSQA
jgi:microcystin-dependent protein